MVWKLEETTLIGSLPDTQSISARRMELIARVTMNEPILALTMRPATTTPIAAPMTRVKVTATGTERDLSAISHDDNYCAHTYFGAECKVDDARGEWDHDGNGNDGGDGLVVEQEAPRQHRQKRMRFPEGEDDEHRGQDVEGTDIAERCLALDPIPTRWTSWRLGQ